MKLICLFYQIKVGLFMIAQALADHKMCAIYLGAFTLCLYNSSGRMVPKPENIVNMLKAINLWVDRQSEISGKCECKF